MGVEFDFPHKNAKSPQLSSADVKASYLHFPRSERPEAPIQFQRFSFQLFSIFPKCPAAPASALARWLSPFFISAGSSANVC